MGQKKQSSMRPLSVGRVHLLSLPLTSLTSELRTMAEMPNAEADCLRHSLQWQTYVSSSVPISSYRTFPHWQPPVSGLVLSLAFMTSVHIIAPTAARPAGTLSRDPGLGEHRFSP